MTASANPLLQTWTTPFGLPPFDLIRHEHFVPAMEEAMKAHLAELQAIAQDPAPATFANTIEAFDRAGRLLAQVDGVYGNLSASETSPVLQEADRVLAPRLAAHRNRIYLDAALFARIDAVHAQADQLGLDAEQRRMLERVHLDFVLAGAKLPEAARARAAQINEALASLCTTFTQNVLHDESTVTIELASEEDCAGLPLDVIAAAESAAAERGMPGRRVITLSRSLVTPFLANARSRRLREQAFKLWTRRGELSASHDNLAVAQQILTLRQELAELHGCAQYADFALRDSMAQRREAVLDLLHRVWEPAKQRAAQELAMMQAQADAQGDGIQVEAWDWRYYAEQIRVSRYQLDDAELKPYFSLERMMAAMFDVAGQLFGIDFVPLQGVALYHPDVMAFEVRRRDNGRTVGLFLSDNFARATKRGGAWMNGYRWQSRVGGEVLPIIVNNNNFAKAPAGQPTLLSVDDLRTLFHEFGHGLHGLLSDVRYERLSGTNVLRDFVELPSQLMEHWAMLPEVLKKHARHVQTGEPIPQALLDKLKAAERFNQGFESVEFTASALVDILLHSRTDAGQLDLNQFEADTLAELGMPRAIVMRHRLPHFQHLFSGPDYASGYYVYLWAAVLDNDAFEAFKQAGNPFDADTAQRLHRFIYASGNTLEPGEAYRRFRGQDAAVEPMLRHRGLLDVA